jgi:hypothetical protein
MNWCFPLQALARLSQHPVAGVVINMTAQTFRSFGDLLAAQAGQTTLQVSDAHGYPKTSDPVALVSASAAGTSEEGRAWARDWSAPHVWRAQRTAPAYTRPHVDSLLRFCDKSPEGSSGGAATPEQRLARLAAWLAEDGGDASRVALGSDANGERGLHVRSS